MSLYRIEKANFEVYIGEFEGFSAGKLSVAWATLWIARVRSLYILLGGLLHPIFGSPLMKAALQSSFIANEGLLRNVACLYHRGLLPLDKASYFEEYTRSDLQLKDNI